ncbi:alpha/beta fold hydrolase [Clostridium psychrophilum]|uniref:alpha/beta fold hydrolase n=1 Tax=Clostridium psychrophilum TaxID=132926 RepID=UPI001C0B68A2|nr:alpha/beta fold hydrolase [Clostridium psychrophilum]MBU3182981.1 alpha/beta hydrolase [Clostridium psychrophilum]
MPEVKIVLHSNDKVEYKGSPWIEYTAKNKIITKGLIIYPGGKVAPQAYAPLAEKLAESGLKVVIVPMPLNLAVFSPNKAEKVIEKYPKIRQWYIAGHSLGGVMAAQFAYKNQDKINGLILLASYPQKSSNLSSSVLKVLSIYGTRDGFVGKDKIDDSKKLLPKSTKWIPIKGGNHSQNGWYGLQKGDNTATITREDQQNIIGKSIVKFISEN